MWKTVLEHLSNQQHTFQRPLSSGCYKLCAFQNNRPMTSFTSAFSPQLFSFYIFIVYICMGGFKIFYSFFNSIFCWFFCWIIYCSAFTHHGRVMMHLLPFVQLWIKGLSRRIYLNYCKLHFLNLSLCPPLLSSFLLLIYVFPSHWFTLSLFQKCPAQTQSSVRSPLRQNAPLSQVRLSRTTRPLLLGFALCACLMTTLVDTVEEPVASLFQSYIYPKWRS